MELAWLEDFKALVEWKNFSRAAKVRNITQPAFGRRVRALESWVGTPLFDRSSHRLDLTPAGVKFQFVAEEVLRRLHQGRQEALEASSAASSLRFLATHALSLVFFPSWLLKVEPLFGAVNTRLMADHMLGCERRMLQGEAHFLLCHSHPAAPHRFVSSDYISVHLGDDLLVPTSAPDKQGKPLHALPGTAKAVTKHLSFSEESGMGQIIAASRARGAIPSANLNTVFSSHLSSVLRMFALEGRGMTWSPHSLVAEDLASGRLVRAGDERWDIRMEIRLYRPESRQDTIAEKFWTHLVQQNRQAG